MSQGTNGHKIHAFESAKHEKIDVRLICRVTHNMIQDFGNVKRGRRSYCEKIQPISVISADDVCVSGYAGLYSRCAADILFWEKNYKTMGTLYGDAVRFSGM